MFGSYAWSIRYLLKWLVLCIRVKLSKSDAFCWIWGCKAIYKKTLIYLTATDSKPCTQTKNALPVCFSASDLNLLICSAGAWVGHLFFRSLHPVSYVKKEQTLYTLAGNSNLDPAV